MMGDVKEFLKMEGHQLHDFFIDAHADELDVELESRLKTLASAEGVASESFASLRPVFVESGIWCLLGVAIYGATWAMQFYLSLK